MKKQFSNWNNVVVVAVAPLVRDKKDKLSSKIILCIVTFEKEARKSTITGYFFIKVLLFLSQ